MRKLILLVFLITSTNILAELCSYDGPQSEMNRCAAINYMQADSFLNTTWGKIKKCLGKHSPAFKGLLKSQRAWIASKKQCENNDPFPGSIAPLEEFSCLEEMTEKRTMLLIDRYEEICSVL